MTNEATSIIKALLDAVYLHAPKGSVIDFSIDPDGLIIILLYVDCMVASLVPTVMLEKAATDDKEIDELGRAYGNDLRLKLDKKQAENSV